MVKRKHGALQDMASTLICENNLLKSLWIKAINTANYELDPYLIMPVLKKKTPYELYKGKKTNISYFKAFGSKRCIYNNDKENCGKFDAARTNLRCENDRIQLLE